MTAPGAAGDALAGREEALRVREEHVALREATAGGDQALLQVRSERLAERARHAREANERLIIASVRAHSLAEAAEQANALKDNFLAMLSHELRNPLAPIRNAAAILGRIAHAEPRLPWIHGVIERQIEQMLACSTICLMWPASAMARSFCCRVRLALESSSIRQSNPAAP